jgi:hypothetical protein
MKTIIFKGYFFRIIKELPKSRVPDYKKIQEKLRADLVIQDKTQTNFLFVEYIPDVEPIEDN